MLQRAIVSIQFASLPNQRIYFWLILRGIAIAQCSLLTAHCGINNSYYFLFHKMYSCEWFSFLFLHLFRQSFSFFHFSHIHREYILHFVPCHSTYSVGHDMILFYFIMIIIANLYASESSGEKLNGENSYRSKNRLYQLPVYAPETMTMIITIIHIHITMCL